MKKKAQSISINTIVVAAIALVVMVLVVMIFTGNMSRFRRNADACENNRGVCINVDDIQEKCSGDYKIVRRDYVCYKISGEADTSRVCCLST
jgi:hypothetical protein